MSGVHPKVLAAIADANMGSALPYGDDDLSKLLNDRFSEMFETSVSVIPCLTGTAANSLALSLMAGPINSVCVHEKSHAYLDECNGPEFYSGAKLKPIPGENGKLSPQSLGPFMAAIGERHSAQPSAISITQTTEFGSVYSLEQIKTLSSFAGNNELSLHMDGARFSNAVAALGCGAADMSWKAGVMAVSLGFTKNGCMAAEAVILFDQTRAEEGFYRQKRAGQLLSKQRFLAAQLLAMLDNNLWLENARRANRQNEALLSRLKGIKGVKVPDDHCGNMAFVRFTPDQIARLQSSKMAGYVYDNNQMRLCCSWETTDDQINAFIDVVTG